MTTRFLPAAFALLLGACAATEVPVAQCGAAPPSGQARTPEERETELAWYNCMYRHDHDPKTVAAREANERAADNNRALAVGALWMLAAGNAASNSLRYPTTVKTESRITYTSTGAVVSSRTRYR
jgi:hypothetical protein